MTFRPRSHSTPSRPLSNIPLSGSLLKLASEVWEQRYNVNNAYYIYRLYARVEEPRPEIYGRSVEISMRIHKLYMLGIKRNEQPQVQCLETFPFGQLHDARLNYLKYGDLIEDHQLLITLTPLANAASLTVENYLTGLLEHTFYHFFSDHSRTIKTKHRVILSVKPHKIIKIITHVVYNIIEQIKGVREAKIGLSNRLDSIIIYTENNTATNQVLDLLRDYQNKIGTSAFRQNLPSMTKIIMRGVATADDPPQINLVNHQPMPIIQSFGTLRADLIYKALKDSNGSSEFFELIVKYFQYAGIDANDPSRQSLFQHLESQAQKNLAEALLANHWSVATFHDSE